jgi:hypothetical protein
MNTKLYMKYVRGGNAGRSFPTGVVDGDTFYKDFPSATSFMFVDLEKDYLGVAGLNVEVIEYLEKNGVTHVVYINELGNFKFTLEQFKNGDLREYADGKFGQQRFVSVSAAERLDKKPKFHTTLSRVVVTQGAENV